ncbi:glycosyltransferase [Kordiimonas laminariae]|uniref:glycosyltransferase n=1 Tax=Kordiimonas laminariae TaxID=2917717 RepID=UPI001FF46E4C|nr:glycosyltransferase [Kordiimonas laminariae]MCK0070287.1 glycosyltransferase [Kordiimonas laminariae]
MKILIISPFENHATGRGDRNTRLAKELSQRGHTVVTFTCNFDHSRKKHIPVDKLSSTSDLKVIRVPGYLQNVSFARILCHFTVAIKLWAWAIRFRWDTVVVSSIPPEVLLATIFLKKQSLIVDIRDIWPDALSSYKSKSIIYKIFNRYCDLIYKFSLQFADRILIVAPDFSKWLKRYTSYKSRKVKLIPLGFQREDFKCLSKGGEDYDFCYAGGATPQFDIQEFAKTLNKEKGIILGDGPLLNKWKESFPKSKFLGSIPRKQAISIMSSSQKLIFPSNKYAQLPNKAFDYFAMGYPVILGKNCSKATAYLLSLRNKRASRGIDNWQDYKTIEKEYLTTKTANIIEESKSK